MSETPGDRPRPTPRPRPGTGNRPSPRPRVAGSRREREEEAGDARTVPSPRPRPGGRPAGTTRPAATSSTVSPEKERRAPSTAAARRTSTRAATVEEPTRRRGRGLVATLAVLCLLAAAGGGFLFWQRTHPSYATASAFSFTRSAVEALYGYDYKRSEESIAAKLAVLTGDLRDQYQKDLSQGGIVDSYQQVSATTSYDVLDVGLKQINDAQDSATLVVFGKYVVKSVNSGDQAAPQGSECEVTDDGAQSCIQTVRVHITRVDGAWKVDDLTFVTTS